MANNLKGAIEKIASDVVGEMTMAKLVNAKLIKTDPPTFKLYDDLIISDSFVITPKYRVFTDKDIGKEFVLQENYGGQEYIYCYEAAGRGQNGTEYSFKGRINKCKLIGTCPHGEVEVTHGIIYDMTHEEGI